MSTISLVAGSGLPFVCRLKEVAANTSAAYFGIVLGGFGIDGARRVAAFAWHLPVLVGETVYAIANAVLVWRR